MARSSVSRRFVLLTASSVLAAGGALIPTGAFAAPQHVGTVVSMAPEGGHGGHGHWNHDGSGHGSGGHDGSNRGSGQGGGVIVIINNTNTNTNTNT
ncbi:hypothetical protein [Streptomyces collinus]|uniref:hypothetical protein n=1 Tax=Streptomyces collinus TaxID=42684 RepID=UPI00331BA40B